MSRVEMQAAIERHRKEHENAIEMVAYYERGAKHFGSAGNGPVEDEHEKTKGRRTRK
jgi:hypothetical protein